MNTVSFIRAHCQNLKENQNDFKIWILDYNRSRMHSFHDETFWRSTMPIILRYEEKLEEFARVFQQASEDNQDDQNEVGDEEGSVDEPAE